MLSRKLANLADSMLVFSRSDRIPSPVQAAAFAAVLLDLSKQAAAMEDHPVPLRARLPRPDKRHARPQQPLRTV